MPLLAATKRFVGGAADAGVRGGARAPPRGEFVEVDGVRLHHSYGGDRSVRAALPAP